MRRLGFLAELAVYAVIATSPQAVLADKPASGDHGPAVALGASLPESSLASERGGTAFPVNNTNQLNAQLYDNQAAGNVTGTNSVSDSAFAGMSGFATVVQNSGNNVIVQNATILNVQLQ